MIVLFTSPEDNYVFAGYEDAKHMARRNSGCEVFCLDKSHSGTHDKNYLDLISGRPEKARNDIMSMRRNLIALDFLTAVNVEAPYILPDWDFLIFQNLVEAFRPFNDCEWAAGIHNDGNMMPAHFLNSLAPLFEFNKILIKLLKTVSDDEYKNCFQDMMIWRMVFESYKFKAGNTAAVVNGSTFDCGMRCASASELPTGFKTDADGYKAVNWVRGIPFFETVDGRPVKANWIHCWGKYKDKTAELRLMNETEYTS